MIKILKNLLKKKHKIKLIKYSIGNVKHHNSHIDTLIPQFIEIGDNFVSAPGSIVLAHDASLFMKYGVYRCEKTIIGNNVFLGANAVVMPGVKIGNNAIIGAGSIVTKDVGENLVVAGNPAKIICSIDEYFEKSKKRKNIFYPPASFDKFRKGARLTKEDIVDFQNKILKDNQERK